jgi:hypothetical protein
MPKNMAVEEDASKERDVLLMRTILGHLEKYPLMV